VEIEELRAEVAQLRQQLASMQARRARMSPAKRRQIEALLRTEMSDRAIAKATGVSPTTIGKIRRQSLKG
jgi:IS30 family transposase